MKRKRKSLRAPRPFFPPAVLSEMEHHKPLFPNGPTASETVEALFMDRLGVLRLPSSGVDSPPHLQALLKSKGFELTLSDSHAVLSHNGLPVVELGGFCPL